MLCFKTPLVPFCFEFVFSIIAKMEERSDVAAIRVIEFFSGIGGWRCALDYSQIPFCVVEAFDINPAANVVYQHNFASCPSSVSASPI